MIWFCQESDDRNRTSVVYFFYTLSSFDLKISKFYFNSSNEGKTDWLLPMLSFTFWTFCSASNSASTRSVRGTIKKSSQLLELALSDPMLALLLHRISPLLEYCKVVGLLLGKQLLPVVITFYTSLVKLCLAFFGKVCFELLTLNNLS